MKALHRLVLLVALATWMALPGVGSDGGDNGGGGGVWILPRPQYLCSGTPADAPHGSASLTNLNNGMTLSADSTMGQPCATVIDPVSGVVVSLQTNGRDVTLPGNLLKNLRDSGCASVNIVIADSTQLGYVITVTFDAATGGASLKTY
jgi:hypothetical protein